MANEANSNLTPEQMAQDIRSIPLFTDANLGLFHR
jgi:hypothetical protein